MLIEFTEVHEKFVKVLFLNADTSIEDLDLNFRKRLKLYSLCRFLTRRIGNFLEGVKIMIIEVGDRLTFVAIMASYADFLDQIFLARDRFGSSKAIIRGLLFDDSRLMSGLTSKIRLLVLDLLELDDGEDDGDQSVFVSKFEGIR